MRPRDALPVSDLDERERRVLAELAREGEGWVSFQGLRRQLGVHQQALVRTLRRLREAGLVAQQPQGGYAVTPQGSALLRRQAWREPEPQVLLHARLPPHVGTGDVAAHLARRWFGGLRWYGQSDAPHETALHWTTDEGRVTVRVGGGSLTLEARAESERATPAFAAVRPVLAAIAELYGLAPGAQPLPGFEASRAVA